MVYNDIIPVLDLIGTIGFLIALVIGIQNYRATDIERPFWLVFSFTAGLGSLWLALVTIEWLGISSQLMDLFSTSLQAVVIGLFAVGVVGTLAIVQDLRESRFETLQQASIVSLLSRVLRHNLRNDMTVLRGSLVELIEKTDLEYDQTELPIDRIDELLEMSDKTRRLESLVADQPPVSEVHVKSLIETVVVDLTDSHAESELTITGDEVVIEVIPEFLELGLSEVIENALQHTQGENEVEIRISTLEGEVTIEVADRGQGLPDQERQLLESGDETALRHGSGIGHWIAYWSCSHLGGTIETDVDESGSAVRITLPIGPAHGRDSAEQRQRLQRLENRFEAVFNEAIEPMVILNDEGRIIGVNEAVTELLGTTREEMLGRNASEYLLDDVGPQPLWQALRSPEREVMRVITADGTERVLEQSVTPDIVPGQHLIVARDITARAKQRHELRETKQRLERALKVSDIGVWELDPDSGEVVWNDTLKRMLGKDPESFNGTVDEFFGRVHPDDTAMAEASLERIMSDGEVESLELRLRHEEGRWIWIKTRGQYIEESDGTGRLVGVAVDITHRMEPVESDTIVDPSETGRSAKH